MATISISSGRVQARLRRWEKVAGLLGDLDVPVSSVAAAQAVPDGAEALQGLRAPGLAVPGRVHIGTWRGGGARRWVAVRAQQPALRLQLRGERYDEVLVTTPDAERLAAALSARTR